MIWKSDFDMLGTATIVEAGPHDGSELKLVPDENGNIELKYKRLRRFVTDVEPDVSKEKSKAKPIQSLNLQGKRRQHPT